MCSIFGGQRPTGNGGVCGGGSPPIEWVYTWVHPMHLSPNDSNAIPKLSQSDPNTIPPRYQHNPKTIPLWSENVSCRRFWEGLRKLFQKNATKVEKSFRRDGPTRFRRLKRSQDGSEDENFILESIFTKFSVRVFCRWVDHKINGQIFWKMCFRGYSTF